MINQSLLGFEDPIDSWTHLLGAIAVLILCILLFTKGHMGKRNPFPILIYGFACIFLFSMSGVYHLLPRDITARYVLRILDHAGIFVLIAGTIIAVHATIFSGFMKWGVITIASLIATVGITLVSIYLDVMPSYLTHIIYIAFGWLGVISIRGLWKLKRLVSMRYLIFGGLAYTLGAVIDLIQYPVIISGYFGPHQIFHLFVLLGATFHWLLLIDAIRTSDELK